jgi:hypothetical protein
MKTGPNALDTAKNMSGSANHENGTRRPRYRGKRLRERKTRKRDLIPLGPPKMNSGAQNKKTGPDALDTVKTCPGAQNMKTKLHALIAVENEYGRAKHKNGTRCPRYCRKRVPTPSLPPKKSHGAKNLKTRPDALGTAKNVPGNQKLEDGTRRPRDRRK